MSTYEQRNAEQLANWVEGNAVHNDIDDECCPDFACCGRVDTPRVTREVFARAIADGDERLQMTMLGGFFGAALADVIGKKEVYIVGDGAKDAD